MNVRLTTHVTFTHGNTYITLPPGTLGTVVDIPATLGYMLVSIPPYYKYVTVGKDEVERI